MSSQWRPLQPDTMPSNGSLSPLQFGQRPVSRQITKNPQNIMQNFQQQQQGQGGGPQQNGFGYNQSFNNSNNAPGGGMGVGGGPGGGGGGGLSNSSSTSRLSSLVGNTSSFDFGLEPGFGGGGGGGGRNLGFPSGGPPPPTSRPSNNGGFNPMMNNPSSQGNGFPNQMSFDRSVSTFDTSSSQMQRSNSSFERQMSVPSNLSDQGKMSMNNGYGGQHQQQQHHQQQRGGGHQGGGGSGNGGGPFGGASNNFYGGLFGGQGGRSGSPPQQNNGRGGMGGSGNGHMGPAGNAGRGGFNNDGGGSGSDRPGFNDMKVGTWNDAPATSNGGNTSGNATGNGTFNNGQMNGSGGSASNFPSVGNFEIGTFNISNSRGGGGGGQGDGGGHDGRGGGHTTSSSRNNGFHNGEGQPPGPGHRETGIIEKLLGQSWQNGSTDLAQTDRKKHSYGFIQCCDRQARLFFHFSQFDGNIEHLKIGDPVEFEVTYDRRTGKPIASTVSKIAPEVVLREERVIGTVTTEARIDPETGSETHGRISYENRGECFFLPFTMSDVEGNVTVAAGDKVGFQMATMARSGNLVARTIRLENPAAPVKYQGVVNSIQEDKSFGFIERADVVREIFFRNSDLEVGENIDLGDNVEFTIQTRNGKEVATNIIKLVAGTVVFEDVGTEYFRGQVLKPIDRNFRAVAEGDALSGRVKYRGQDRSEKEVQFGETDQVGDFTLKHGDWIKFVIAVDRRDKHPRATKIELLDESFGVSDERREQGTINNTKEGFGFIQCADRDAKIFFHFSECLDVSRQPREGDDCEFTVADDPNHAGQLMATRIKLLAPGTVQFSVTVHPDAVGKVEIEPSKNSWTKNGSNSGSSSPAKEGIGKIIYELNGLNLGVPLHANDCDLRDFPRKGDIVRFDINQLKSTKETNAINIRIIETQHPRDALIPTSVSGTGHVLSKPSDFTSLTATPSAGSSDLDSPASVSGTDKSSSGDHGETVQQGYIAALKDGFGFIETISHDKEIFFHFSNVESKPERLEVGLEVEYTVFNRDKGGKVSAENVKLLRKGTIPPIPGKEEVLHGKVVRPLRSVNPDRNDYCGLIQVKNEDGSVLIDYRFGIASLSNKKELLQVNDPVQFNADLNEEFAMNIHATREKLRAMVEAMKGQYGFLSYEVDEGRKLFFHTSEVESNESLSEGDEVEFVVITNKRTGKHSACCVRKLSSKKGPERFTTAKKKENYDEFFEGSSKRPERLISKLKAMNLEDAARSGRKIVVLRQPKGPDGSKGFAAKRAYL